MDESRPSLPKDGSEIPVNLPANRYEPAYVSDYMAELLSRLGFDYAFLLPGSSYRGLHDSLVNYGRNHKPEIVMATHEGTAISMAHGYAKATGRPSLCILHDLVGLMNGTMGVYNALCDQTPVVILGGSGPADPGKRRFIDWTHSARSQSDLVKPFVKWTAEPPTPQAMLDAIAEAYRIAATPPWGPVYVSIDAGLQELEAAPGSLVVPDVAQPRYQAPPPVAANPEALDRAAEALVGARMPLVVCGQFSAREEMRAPLLALVEGLGAAAVEERDGQCLPTGHRQNLTGDREILAESDVILLIDCQDPNQPLGVYTGRRGDMRASAGGAARPFVIDLSLNAMTNHAWADLGGPLAPVDLTLLAERHRGLVALGESVARRLKADPAAGGRIGERVARLAERHAAIRARQGERRARPDWNQAPILPGRLAEALWNAVKGKKWTLTVRHPRCFQDGSWEFEGAGDCHVGSGGGGVGYGPGAAVGAALALRGAGRIPVAVIGDGDFVMNAGALWSAAHYRIPMLMVVNNNQTWGNDENHQIHIAEARGRPVDNAPIGQRMHGPGIDLATVARGYGAWAEGPVTEPGELEAVMRRAVAAVESGQAALVDVRTKLTGTN